MKHRVYLLSVLLTALTGCKDEIKGVSDPRNVIVKPDHSQAGVWTAPADVNRTEDEASTEELRPPQKREQSQGRTANARNRTKAPRGRPVPATASSRQSRARPGAPSSRLRGNGQRPEFGDAQEVDAGYWHTRDVAKRFHEARLHAGPPVGTRDFTARDHQVAPAGRPVGTRDFTALDHEVAPAVPPFKVHGKQFAFGYGEVAELRLEDAEGLRVPVRVLSPSLEARSSAEAPEAYRVVVFHPSDHFTDKQHEAVVALTNRLLTDVLVEDLIKVDYSQADANAEYAGLKHATPAEADGLGGVRGLHNYGAVHCCACCGAAELFPGDGDACDRPCVEGLPDGQRCEFREALFQEGKDGLGWGCPRLLEAETGPDPLCEPAVAPFVLPTPEHEAACRALNAEVQARGGESEGTLAPVCERTGRCRFLASRADDREARGIFLYDRQLRWPEMDRAIQQGDALRVQFLYTEMWDWPLYLKDLVTELRFSAGDSMLHAVVRKHAEIGKHGGENSFMSRAFVHLLGSSAGAIAGLQPRVWPTSVVSAWDAQKETPLHTAVGALDRRMVEGLLPLGADPLVRRGQDGLTSLELAFGLWEQKKLEFAEYYEQCGEDKACDAKAGTSAPAASSDAELARRIAKQLQICAVLQGIWAVDYDVDSSSPSPRGIHAYTLTEVANGQDVCADDPTTDCDLSTAKQVTKTLREAGTTITKEECRQEPRKCKFSRGRVNIATLDSACSSIRFSYCPDGAAADSDACDYPVHWIESERDQALDFQTNTNRKTEVSLGFKAPMFMPPVKLELCDLDFFRFGKLSRGGLAGGASAKFTMTRISSDRTPAQSDLHQRFSNVFGTSWKFEPSAAKRKGKLFNDV